MVFDHEVDDPHHEAFINEALGRNVPEDVSNQDDLDVANDVGTLAKQNQIVY